MIISFVFNSYQVHTFPNDVRSLTIRQGEQFYVMCLTHLCPMKGLLAIAVCISNCCFAVRSLTVMLVWIPHTFSENLEERCTLPLRYAKVWTTDAIFCVKRELLNYYSSLYVFGMREMVAGILSGKTKQGSGRWWQASCKVIKQGSGRWW